ncbi:MAG TPA: nucleotide sugar dehydrogenase [Anaerolineae bacterium]|nr:nucleotide sugar dehydrogenase [Anaerolineae bacterium]
MRNICVIGVGYVGLVTGTCFADLGHQVSCVDVDKAKIEKLQAGVMPIYEPGLEEMVRRNAQAGRLKFTTCYEEGLKEAEFAFISVGTPQGSGGEADLKYVRAAARSIGEVMDHSMLIINKSTVPIGTGDWVSDIVKRYQREPIDFSVVSNPEFLREGAAINDFMFPDRIVLGSLEPDAAAQVAQLYLSLRAPIMLTDLRTAEMIKYASNAFLATRISFINEIAGICEALGADVKEVAAGMGYDKRIGRHFLDAGIGFGGSCFEGQETVFVQNSPDVIAQTFETVFAASGEPAQAGSVQMVQPAEQRVLAFDLETGCPTLADVQVVTRRPYRGIMVTLTTSMGRSLRVTADHPVIVHTNAGPEILPAFKVSPGQELMILTDLPPLEPHPPLDLIALLRDTPLEADVHVASPGGEFAAQFASYQAHIPADRYRHKYEIKYNNRMPLWLFRHLSEVGVLSVPHDRLQLYTAKGAGARINAVIPVDQDLLRLCGYYLAEGYLGSDTGRAGATRQRLGWCFHEDEAEYIADIRRILQRWGLKYTERLSTHALTTVVSSRVLAWLFRDVLRLGTHSADKALPALAFRVPPELRYELLRGAFSGDGAVTPVQGGKNLMLEYATVSKRLADGLVLLMQTIGVVPSIRIRWMNKSTQPAYILRVSGYAQLAALQDVFGERRRSQISAVLAGYRRHIRQRGFTRGETYSTVTVKSVEYEDVETMVYSMETSTGTLVASSGLICHNCFPKDVQALAHMAAVHGCHPQLLRAVMDINRDQRRQVVHKLREVLGSLDEKVVGVLGLAFKPNTDDMREAPSVELIHLLQSEGACIRAYDPVATPNAGLYLHDVTLCEDAYEVAEAADALVVVTEWNEFKHLSLSRLKAVMRQPVIVDGRNLYDPEIMQELGFVYRGVGRGYA